MKCSLGDVSGLSDKNECIKWIGQLTLYRHAFGRLQTQYQEELCI
jgi:hypothetical protein